jgi:large subunit ribosomal protein L28
MQHFFIKKSARGHTLKFLTFRLFPVYCIIRVPKKQFPLNNLPKEQPMIKRCFICDKGPMTGKEVVRKGLIKKKGGTGSKIVRSNKRQFLPNLQRIRILVNNAPKRVYVCTKCIKKGNLVKV